MSTRNKSILKKFDDLHEEIGSEELFDIFCSLREEATDAVTISEFSKSLIVHHALDDEIFYFSDLEPGGHILISKRPLP